MLKFVGFAVQRTVKSLFLTMVNKRHFGMGPTTALSIDRDFEPAANVNVLSSTLVRLYRARTPLFQRRSFCQQFGGFRPEAPDH